MKAKIRLGMRFGVVGNLRKPWARHHDAGGIDEPGLEGCDGCCVHGMSHAHIVGVNDQELCIGRESKFFCERFIVRLGGNAKRSDNKIERKQEQE